MKEADLVLSVYMETGEFGDLTLFHSLMVYTINIFLQNRGWIFNQEKHHMYSREKKETL